MSLSRGWSVLSMSGEFAERRALLLSVGTSLPRIDVNPTDEGSAGGWADRPGTSFLGLGWRRDGAAPASSSDCASCAPAPVFPPPGRLVGVQLGRPERPSGVLLCGVRAAWWVRRPHLTSQMKSA